MAYIVEIVIKGDGDVLKLMGKLEHVLGHMKPVLEPVGEYLQKFYSGDVFTTEGQIIGETWAGLKESTVRQKVKKYPGRGILEASGSMMKSFDVQTTDTFMKLWNKADYAHWHQTGTKRMSQRMILKLDKNRADKVTEMVAHGVARELQKAI